MIKQLHVNEFGRVSAFDENNRRLETTKAPTFSFEYDTLKYLDFNKSFTINGVEFALSEEQQAEIIDYMSSIKENTELTQMIAENYQNQLYLKNTDWYITRKIENGTEIPQDILDKRQLARDSMHAL